MKYQKKSFSVPASSERKDCKDHWWDVRGFCVFCGAELIEVKTMIGPRWEAKSDWDNPFE